MADLNLQMVLRFVDQATRPARAAMQQIDQMGRGIEAQGRKQVEWSRQQREANVARAAALGTESGALAAQGYAYWRMLGPAIEMEAKMAEVSKVVDFDPIGIRKLQQGILDLTTSGGLPMAASGIADIITAAGQAGIVDKALPDDEEARQLIEFGRSAAEMGVAFDIAASAAGDAMTSWRSRMGLTQAEALDLGDAINYLGNNLATNAAAITDVVGRQGALAMQAGLTYEEVAALSAAFTAAAPSPEIAATALKNFTGALTAGEAMTDRQAAVLRSLGFDAKQMAVAMQKDAVGSIISVMEALSRLPEEERGSAIRQLFGEESAGAIAPLLQNLDGLRKAFDLVADKEDRVGSMHAEFVKASSTVAAKIRLLQQSLTAFAITVGTQFLEPGGKMVEVLTQVVQAATKFAETHPEIIQVVGAILAAGFAFNVLSVAARLFGLTTVISIANAIGALGWLNTAIGIVLRAIPALAGPWGWVALAAAAALYLIYDNWGSIVEWFQGKIDRIKAAFDKGLFQGVFQVIAEFNPFRLMLDIAGGLADLLIEKLGLDPVAAHIVKSMVSINPFDGIVDFASDLASRLISALNLQPVVDHIVNFFAGLNPFSGISLPSWLGGSAADAVPPVNAPASALITPRINDTGAAPITATAPITAGSRTVINNTTNDVGGITINAAPDQSEDALARRVADRIGGLRGGDAALHDGGAYAD